ncbi:hypothetical protein K435DRAFT_789663 [Dendrothele bispora CBS 962.96]|uniref:Uncharacterized protein n=1 Tax=Dendrothele bispora (strain CBS 962.96) TaxID=1314807 RepID=A0A4S8MV12_DENBC|nr:hypothetical protein K435DRAFT_789663 [Dendrothele bispora CBS 962.96]
MFHRTRDIQSRLVLESSTNQGCRRWKRLGEKKKKQREGHRWSKRLAEKKKQREALYLSQPQHVLDKGGEARNKKRQPNNLPQKSRQESPPDNLVAVVIPLLFQREGPTSERNGTGLNDFKSNGSHGYGATDAGSTADDIPSDAEHSSGPSRNFRVGSIKGAYTEQDNRNIDRNIVNRGVFHERNNINNITFNIYTWLTKVSRKILQVSF